MALFLLYGTAFAPAAFAAIVIADVTFRGLSDAPVSIVASALTVALGYAAAAAVLRRLLPIDPQLNDHRDLLRLLGVSLLATGAIAIAVVSIFASGRLLPPDEAVETAIHFWVGDMIGIAGLTPFLLLLHESAQRLPPRPRRGWEHALQGGAIALGLWIIFGLESTNHFEFSYVLFLPLIWIALRDGLLGACWGIVITQIGLVLSIQVKGFDADVTTQFQLLMLAVAFVGLLLGSVVDERRRAETSLRDSEARLQAVLATAPDGILTFDDGGVITSANRAAAAMFGGGPGGPLGTPVRDLLPSLPRRAAAVPAEAEILARRPDGSVFDAEVAVGEAPVAGRILSVAVVRDISARKQAERQLKQHEMELAHAGRLAVTGEMAASLAHELNQPLTAVVTFARACQEILKAPGPAERTQAGTLIDKVVQQALRAGEIIRTTREFLRRGETRRGRIDIREVAAIALDLVRADALLNRIDIALDIPESVPPVLADAIQMEQVVLNLLRNSMEAMSRPEHGRREIAVSARLDPADPEFVEVAIRDTGPGIPAEVADSLFRPFATTKSSGMGLGLSISRSIVEAHGGRIWSVAPPSGQGAEIRFTLPVYMDERSEL